MYSDLSTIKTEGFTGFYTISQLWCDQSLIPDSQGIYLILHPSNRTPVFLEKGVGCQSPKDLNLTPAKLSGRWIPGCMVLYVGKAGGAEYKATLNSRLKDYLDFGRGKSRRHYGGRLIWRLEHHASLLVAWKALPNANPRTEELLLGDAIESYYGRRPFANLKK